MKYKEGDILKLIKDKFEYKEGTEVLVVDIHEEEAYEVEVLEKGERTEDFFSVKEDEVKKWSME